MMCRICHNGAVDVSMVCGFVIMVLWMCHNGVVDVS
jgi:hypothetical protein